MGFLVYIYLCIRVSLMICFNLILFLLKCCGLGGSMIYLEKNGNVYVLFILYIYRYV